MKSYIDFVIFRIEIIKKYWLVILIGALLGFQFVLLNSTEFTCISKQNKCVIKETAFFGLLKTKKELNLSDIKQFKLRYNSATIPVYRNDGNWYYIYANTKNNQNKLIMESFHSNKPKAEKIVNDLNKFLISDKENIQIKF